MHPSNSSPYWVMESCCEIQLLPWNNYWTAVQTHFVSKAESHTGPSIHTMAALAFGPRDGDAVSPCSSILVTVKRRRRGSSVSPVSRDFNPHCVSERFASTSSLSIILCSSVNHRIARPARRCNKPRSPLPLALPKARGKTGSRVFY